MCIVIVLGVWIYLFMFYLLSIFGICLKFQCLNILNNVKLKSVFLLLCYYIIISEV